MFFCVTVRFVFSKSFLNSSLVSESWIWVLMTLGWLVAPCHCSLMLNIFIFILFIFSFRAVIKHAPCTTDVEVSIFKTAGAGKQHELWILYMCFILLISSPRNSSFIDSKGCYSVAKETQDVSFIGSAVSRQSIIQHTHIIIPHTHTNIFLSGCSESTEFMWRLLWWFETLNVDTPE